jgi:predicted MFS family arabinose efflux permease
VFVGALLVDSYHASPGAAGLLLGLAAVAYLPGNFLARRWIGDSTQPLLAILPLAGAVLGVLLGAYRPAPWLSTATLAALAFVAGARTILGSALGFEVCSRRRVFAMRIRAAATQFGYLIGAAAGGVALSVGGYALLGATFALLFALAATPHAVTFLLYRGTTSTHAEAAADATIRADVGPC